MGTNYYLHQKEKCCSTCGREFDPIHIGKSSIGWVFSIHIIPENGINTLEDWKREWKGKIIKDEYGDIITEEEMLNIITNRKGNNNSWKTPPYNYISWAEFHVENHSQEGPDGLLRHQIGEYCRSHGLGTWDYLEGDFS